MSVACFTACLRNLAPWRIGMPRKSTSSASGEKRGHSRASIPATLTYLSLRKANAAQFNSGRGWKKLVYSKDDVHLAIVDFSLCSDDLFPECCCVRHGRGRSFETLNGGDGVSGVAPSSSSESATWRLNAGCANRRRVAVVVKFTDTRATVWCRPVFVRLHFERFFRLAWVAVP